MLALSAHRADTSRAHLCCLCLLSCFASSFPKDDGTGCGISAHRADASRSQCCDHVSIERTSRRRVARPIASPALPNTTGLQALSNQSLLFSKVRFRIYLFRLHVLTCADLLSINFLNSSAVAFEFRCVPVPGQYDPSLAFLICFLALKT